MQKSTASGCVLQGVWAVSNAGGKRAGAGRKPGPHGAKVSLTVGISQAVKDYLASTGNSSDAIEKMVRRSAGFREWQRTAEQ